MQEKRFSVKDTIRIDELRLKGLSLCQKKPDSSIVYINEAIDMSRAINDNLRVAKGLNCLGIAYNAKSDFEKSFILYREALDILENEESLDTQSAVYNNIGNIYQSFGQYDLAESYYVRSIAILMEVNSPVKASFLNNTFENLAFVNFYEERYEKSLAYIEKAQQIIDNENVDKDTQDFRNARILMLKGIVYLELGNIDVAEKLLLDNYDTIELSGETTHIAQANYYIGSMYKVRGKHDKAVTYFLKALALSNSIKDLSLKAEIQLDLAATHQILEQYKLAFEYLTMGTALKDSLFGTRNTWKISELKDNYEKAQQEQQLILAQKEKKIDHIMKAIYLSGAIIIGLFGLLYFSYLRTKHKKEKKLIEKEKQIAELELNKTKDILEIKNKELTTSALQIIEDGELIKHFKDDIYEIKKGVDEVHQQKIDNLLASVNRNSKKNWDAFKLRFEQVNSGFFEKLGEQYPTLTPTELKLCSFLKLHFNSKDIANLMGISSKSVKMGRYRLRKKFNLPREVNLTEFISRF
ncbi:tetratricopeptide repeat protein [Aquimarina sp. 2201CG1-2-11]|uniref:tetratricopeptide repeat protein n=1 Tax=Aquimarina discodermiae TaxID=3231043 RepID=UPI003461A796